MSPKQCRYDIRSTPHCVLFAFPELDLLVPLYVTVMDFGYQLPTEEPPNLENFCQKVQIKCQQPRRNAHKLPMILWLITLPFNIGTKCSSFSDPAIVLNYYPYFCSYLQLFDNKVEPFFFFSTIEGKYSKFESKNCKSKVGKLCSITLNSIRCLHFLIQSRLNVRAFIEIMAIN